MDAARDVSIRPAMEKAIALFGSEQKLAEACDVTQPAIWKAKTTGKISPELALAIHKATGGEVPASALRPDLWRQPEHVPLAPTAGAPLSPAATVDGQPPVSSAAPSALSSAAIAS
jgi:DNA-binding transcriptional regulator YdaS (Cro superfamily)